MVQYQLALHQIESRRKDGKFIGIDGSIPEGQGIVMAHLNECHELIEMVEFLVSVGVYTWESDYYYSSKSQWTKPGKTTMTKSTTTTRKSPPMQKHHHSVAGSLQGLKYILFGILILEALDSSSYHQ